MLHCQTKKTRREGSSSQHHAHILYIQVGLSDTLGDLANIFDRDHYALVVTEQLQYTGGVMKSSTISPRNAPPGMALASATRSVVTGIVTRIDLLNYISSKPSEEALAGFGRGPVSTAEK